MRLLKYAYMIIISSEFQKHQLNENAVKACVLPEFIKHEDIRHRQINSVQPRIYVEGDLERFHNVSAVVKAYAIVKQKYPRAELVINGRGTQLEGLDEYLDRNRIYGVKIVDEAEHSYFSDTDIYINSYRIDYFSYNAIKALASGLPVISSPLSDDEYFTNRENIMFFKFNDYLSLADRIFELVEDNLLVSRLSKAGKNTALGFDVIANKMKWSKIYSSRE